ncbi:MAG TPA: hypothetical protein VFN48_02590 [Solirubrobacteraceae bacterium]|nr:hypothetical protein [Solirubrobacteraceae bacterium]
MQKAISGLAGAGALLLTGAQFLPLYHTHVPSLRASVGSSSVGADHAYGVLIIALMALALAVIVRVRALRYAVWLLGVLGVVSLIIALGHDLVAAHAHGLKLVGDHYETATNVLGAGLYVELLGALVLISACLAGILLAPHSFVAVSNAGSRKASVP